MNGWQPIETARKDRRILLWLEDEGFAATATWKKFFDGDEGFWLLEMDEPAENHVVPYWTDLPEPPETEE